MFKFIIKINLLILIVSLSGCAIFSSSYPSKMSQTKADIFNNNPKQAAINYDAEFTRDVDKGTLNDLELARLAQFNSQPKKSQEIYATVINQLAQQMLQAVIQVKSLFENTEAVATNDKVLPYLVPDYAQTFVYSYQAINYLNQNDLSNALVSIRQLSLAQAWITQQKKINTQSTKSMDEKYKDKNEGDNGVEYLKSKEFKKMVSSSDKITNSYENGFAYYLSSILYQGYNKDYNDAFVSIKSAARLLPDNAYVADTYKQIQLGFKGYSPYEKGQGRLVVIYQQGLVSPKKAFYLPIFLGYLGVQNITLPYYSSDNINPLLSNVSIEKDGKNISKAKMSLLVNTQLMAMKSLTEEYPAIVIREVVRIIFKSSVTYAMSRQKGNAGIAGLIVGSIYSVATSAADLRSWLLLPKDVQLYEKTFTAGDYELVLSGEREKFKIEPGKTALILVTHIGKFMQVDKHQI